MQFAVPRRRTDEDARILPLINVVFLLLIFFMLAGRFAAFDPFAVEPPRSASEGAGGSGEVVVLLGADGRLALDGEVMDEPALARAVRERLAGGGGPVRLKADGRSGATKVVAVMELLRDAGVERLKLLTLPGGG